MLREIITRHPDSDLGAYNDQWTKTKRFTSLQVLEVLRLALEDENLNLCFDYFSTVRRCEALYSSIQEDLIAGSMKVPELVQEDIGIAMLDEMAKKKERNIKSVPTSESNARISFRNPMMTTNSLLLDDIQTPYTPLGVTPDFNRVRENHKMTPWALKQYLDLRMANVSLSKASQHINRTIENEGDAELRKSGAACVPVISEDWHTFFNKPVEAKGETEQ